VVLTPLAADVTVQEHLASRRRQGDRFFFIFGEVELVATGERHIPSANVSNMAQSLPITFLPALWKNVAGKD
jgi:hypothetical protein